MRAIAVIPARLASTRLPRKMLREIAGKPLVGAVYEVVRFSPLLNDVIIATDSDEILQVCRRNGWKAQMTSAAHSSGTQRVHEVSNSIAADIYLNVQGDEPLTRPEHIATLIDVMQDSSVHVGTLKTTASAADITNPNAVKVVTASRLVCLPQTRVRSLCSLARVVTRAQRTPRAVAVLGERNSNLCGRYALRHDWN